MPVKGTCPRCADGANGYVCADCQKFLIGVTAPDLPPGIPAAAERWVYASGGKSHGKVEQQVRSMAERIVRLALTNVAIEVTSDETYRLREKCESLEREIAALRACLLKNSIYAGDLKEADAIRRAREGDVK